MFQHGVHKKQLPHSRQVAVGDLAGGIIFVLNTTINCGAILIQIKV